MLDRHTPSVRLACALALNLAAAASGVTIRDKVGDFKGSDVAAVSVDVRQGAALFTITYATDVISAATCTGGKIGIDADRNRATGLKDSPGFDFQITYNVSQVAPTAQIDTWSGPNAGASVQIGSHAGNGSRLSFDARNVRLLVPLRLIGGAGDFHFAVFATGMFSVGRSFDRVPDHGVIRSTTGQVVGAAVAGTKARHVLRTPTAAGPNRIIACVATAVEGNCGVWTIETTGDLPVDALAFGRMMTLTLALDIDRQLATGMEASDVAFLPFGADRSIRCTLMPGKDTSFEVVRGTTATGQKLYVGGGAGVNGLRLEHDRRRARLTVPLDALGARSTAFDWMLTAALPMKKRTDVFLDASVQFDTGRVVRPLAMPIHATVVADPVDASVKASTGGGMAGLGAPVRNLANTELRKLTAALTPQYLVARITYDKPITYQPEYFTSLVVTAPDAAGRPRSVTLGMNWHLTLGAQAMVFGAAGSDGASPMTPGHQFLATQGREASVLLPASLFGAGTFRTADVHVVTSQIIEGRDEPSEKQRRVPTNRVRPLPSGSTLDRLPDQGVVRLQAR